MQKLEQIYQLSINQTKHKIMDDILKFIEDKTTIPTIEQYIETRNDYLHQLWQTIWMNNASNRMSKNDKRNFLFARNYDLKDSGKNIVNQLFRKEIVHHFQDFQPINWLIQHLEDNPNKWEELHKKARENYFKKQEEKIITAKIRKISSTIQLLTETAINRLFDQIYLYIRHQIGKQLQLDFDRNLKYKLEEHKRHTFLQEDGKLKINDYQTVREFFDEITGEFTFSNHRGRSYYDYEYYLDKYEQLVLQHVFDYGPNYLLAREKLIGEEYKVTVGQDITLEIYTEMIEETLFDLVEELLRKLEEEEIKDLIEVGNMTYDESTHEKILTQQMEAKSERKRKELEELQRKHEEEQRIIEDVFSKEYQFFVNRNVQYILHIGETNTGKTYQAIERMKEAESGLYLAPLRLLALEVYDTLNEAGVACSLKTGEEEKIHLQATHMSSTVEMFHEKEYFEVIVIDEAQMIADPERGFSWFKAITKANAKEVHIIGSENIKILLEKLLAEATLSVNEYRRDVPLKVEDRPFSLDEVRNGDALVCFSRKKVIETAALIRRRKIRVSMIYGSMPPETRKMQIQQFINGKTNVIVATDAIGMGLNLPIRRVVFLDNEKFDGVSRRRLTSQEVKQIGGRAGRKGIYNIGRVAFTSQVREMKRLLEMKDQPIQIFTIAPTSAVFERFQRYSRDLHLFFKLWEKYQNPSGTLKASLKQEQDLYELIQNTEIEARLSLTDMYGFLHLPFSANEPSLVKQWLLSMEAIISGDSLPEPIVKLSNLDEMELSYKAIGLHLLFLYRLGERTEATYWERIRQEITENTNAQLIKELKTYKKTCKRCGRKLPIQHTYPICDSCYTTRY